MPVEGIATPDDDAAAFVSVMVSVAGVPEHEVLLKRLKVMVPEGVVLPVVEATCAKRCSDAPTAAVEVVALFTSRIAAVTVGPVSACADTAQKIIALIAKRVPRAPTATL